MYHIYFINKVVFPQYVVFIYYKINVLLKKQKPELLYGPAIPLQDIYPKIIESRIWKRY